ncbi:MAG TPA: tetratricopeptide repeat protein [Methylophilaceae bacterium]|jgi:hypothetical protein
MPLKQKLLNYLQNHNRGRLLALLTLVFLIYLPFLANPFIFDDLNFLSDNLLNHFAHSSFHFDLRWFPYASLGWTWILFLDTPHFFRLGNALLHATNAVLLFFLLRQIISIVHADNSKSLNINGVAWTTAVFFACNPVAVYAVGYLIQRSILMATLFTLAMQLAYLRGLLSGQKRWLLLSVVFFFFAVFSKEQSVMAPAIILTTTIMLRSNTRIDLRTLWVTWVAYLIIATLILLRVKGVLGIVYEHDAVTLLNQQEPMTQHILAGNPLTLRLLSIFTQAGLFFKYLFLWLIPNPAWMSIDMRETFSMSWQAWGNWLKIGVFLSYGLIGFRLLLSENKMRLIGWALLYPWLFFLPEFSTIRVQEPFVLYRSYLWMPGMMVLIALAVEALPSRKMIIAGGLISLLFIPLAWNRLWVMADNYRLWNDAAVLLDSDTTPGAARIFYNRGNAELAKGRWNDALSDLKRVSAINPELGQVYAQMGAAYFSLSKYNEAITAFDEAISINPDYSQAYFGKGMALKKLHSDDAAMTAIEKSCSLGNVSGCTIVSLYKAASAKNN